MRLSHTDLKPENMLFLDTTYDVNYNTKEVSKLIKGVKLMT